MSERVRFLGEYRINGDYTHSHNVRGLRLGDEGTMQTPAGETPGIVHVNWDKKGEFLRIDEDCVELIIPEEEISMAVESIKRSFVDHLEEITMQAEQEAATREFLIVQGDGDWVTQCPQCNSTSTIREVDRDVRWNELQDIEQDDDGSFRCVASTDNDSSGGWENDGYICESCMTELCAPSNFEITDWY